MKLFYSDEYVKAGHGFDTTRKAKWVADSLKRDPIRDVELIVPMTLFGDEIVSVHSRAYVRAIETGQPRELAESQGFKWDKDLWHMVCASNAGVMAAACEALEDGVSGSLSSGLHHARKGRGDGFCTFNGLALAADLVHQRFAGAKYAKRILVLDLDAHCGGGTFEILGKRSWITIADISVDDYDHFSIPESSPRHSLEIIKDAGLYDHAVSERLRMLSIQHIDKPFDLCLYNAGMDPFEGNTKNGGLKGITQEILGAREEKVFQWCFAEGIPVAFVLAGGYADDESSRKQLVDLHRMTIESASKISK